MPANKFNSFAAVPYNGGVNLSSDTVKFLLTNTLPVASNTQYSDISATELANGNGYTSGGATATLVSSSQSSGVYHYIATLPSPTWTSTASGGSFMGPFRYIVAYDFDASPQYLLGWWDYGSSLSLAFGETFSLPLDGTNGVVSQG